MLLQRIITGIILAAISLAVIFYGDDFQFIVFIGIFTTLAAWEWSRLAGWEKLWQQILYAGIVGLLPVMLLTFFFYSWTIGEQTPLFIYYAVWVYGISFILSPLIWFFGLFKLIKYQRGDNSKLIFKSSIGFGILSAAYLALIALKNAGVEWLLFLLGLIWIADIGAFFVGRAFGKHKLADRVSPGKTWEGVWGALGLSTLFSLVISIYMPIMPIMNGIVGVLAFVGLSLITVAFSIIGDLFESLVKRQMNMKDSSQLLPGHGGFLDRLDSVIAAAPIFVIGLSILSYFKLIVFAHKHTVI